MRDFSFIWETLIIVISDVILVLASARAVTSKMRRRREEVDSGMVVVAGLSAVTIAAEALNSLAEQETIKEEEFPPWFSDKLVSLHPRLSTLFEASVARLMPSDVCLAAHLSLFQRIYSEIEIVINKLSQDFDYFHKYNITLRPKKHILADYRLILRDFNIAIEHAKCAEDIITKVILSRISTWHRIRRKFYMSRKEERCKNILEQGTANMLLQRNAKNRSNK